MDFVCRAFPIGQRFALQPVLMVYFVWQFGLLVMIPK